MNNHTEKVSYLQQQIQKFSNVDLNAKDKL